MNEILATINFTTQKFIIDGIDLISGDFNSTKIKFKFEDNKTGTKVVEIRPLDSDDKNPTFMATIENNEVILVSKDENDNNATPFTQGGTYLMEVSLYGNNSKLSTITKYFKVLDEQIILSDGIVTPYLPVFDELMQQIVAATNAAENVNISCVKIGKTVTITITNRNGVSTSVSISDGEDGTNGIDGVGILSIIKTSTTGLVDTYTITLTNNTTYTFTVTNGKGIVSITKTATVDNVDTYTITYNDGTTTTFTVTNSTVTDQEFNELKNKVDTIDNTLSDLEKDYEYNKNYINALIKIETTGTSLQIDNTAKCPMSLILNPSIINQTTPPSFDNPQTLHIITGNNTITIGDTNNVHTQTITLNLDELEYCKIGNYADEFVNVDNKWYLRKKINKITLNGTENYTREISNGAYFIYAKNDVVENTTNAINVLSNRLIGITPSSLINSANVGICSRRNAGNHGLIIRPEASSTMTTNDFKTLLSNNNMIVYYPTTNTTDILLNDTLQTQLDNATNWLLSYQTETNISQSNADLPFVITAITCYDLNNLLNRVQTLEEE